MAAAARRETNSASPLVSSGFGRKQMTCTRGGCGGQCAESFPRDTMTKEAYPARARLNAAPLAIVRITTEGDYRVDMGWTISGRPNEQSRGKS